MRTKKDPGIRQEAFVNAATELFMEKGYEAVSIRDILDAVADRSASPSVFYYYFSSKDELYRACIEAVAANYLSVMREGFSVEGKTTAEWMLSLVATMEEYLLNERNLIMTGSSVPNRLFILDMRERVTKEIGAFWTESLIGTFGVPAADVQGLAQFLSGGIGEMMFTFMFETGHDRQEVQQLAGSIVRFCMNTIDLPEMQKLQLLDALNKLHDKNQ